MLIYVMKIQKKNNKKIMQGKKVKNCSSNNTALLI